MENKNWFKYLITIIVVLIITGIFYFVVLRNLYTPPKQILTPDIYPSGTTVSLYDEAPSVFPKEVILENKTIKYSGTVAIPGGKTQTSVSYVSDNTMPAIVDIYMGALPNMGWEILAKTVDEKVSLLRASKGDEVILLSISPIKKGEVLVTFQYEK